MKVFVKNSILCLMCLSLSLHGIAQNKNVKNARKKVMNDDKKELDNLAVRSFSWLTGTSTDNDYVSVGKVAHYFGVISLRLDSGHTLSRGGFGKSVFQLLNDSQKEEMLSLLEELKVPLADYHKNHNEINRQLEKLLRRETFNLKKCKELSENQSVAEGEIGVLSAKVFYKIYNSLSEEQLNQVKIMRAEILAKSFEDFNKKEKSKLKNISHEDQLELWNLCTRFGAWITGEQDDVTFSTTGKTSQHFGFVSVRVGSGHGVTRGGVSKQVLSVLNDSQKKALKSHVTKQKSNLTQYYLLRRNLTITLRNLLISGSLNEQEILVISKNMGSIEGEMTYKQALLYVELRESLSQEQIASFFEMRSAFLPFSEAKNTNDNPLVRGEKIFGLCAMCHSLKEGENLIGPSLYRIINRPAAAVEGYNYSPEMKSKNINWTKKNLDVFLENPKKFIPSTTMPFSGVENASDRKALILYLESLR